jgi:hypothetical protein
MTTTEDRLTTALNARADQVRPEDLTYQSPPATPRSLPRVPRPAVFALIAAAAVAAIAAPFVVGGPPQQARPQPGHQPGLKSAHPSNLRPEGPTLQVEVFYGRKGTQSLVSRHVRIPERGDPMMRALELAAQEPTEPGLTALVPAGSVPQVNFDGSGRYGAFSLAFPDRAWIERPSAMGLREARLAQRAVLCTVQSFGGVHGGHQPIGLYFRSGSPAGTRLFGIPLPPTRDHAMNVDCS